MDLMTLLFYVLVGAVGLSVFGQAVESIAGSAIPANGPDVLCDDDVGAICWRFDLNLALMSMPKRPNLSAGRAENPPQASSGRTSPVTNAIAVWFS